MKPNQFVDIFKTLNLTEDHSRVYYVCVEKGSCPASTIAQNAGVPRSTCYSLLEDLIDLGLVTSTKVETKTLFSPESPEKILTLLRQKEQQIQEQSSGLLKNISLLVNLYESHKPDFPGVKFYQGAGGLKALYFDSLSADEILVVSQGSAEVQDSYAKYPDYIKAFVDECLLGQVKTRAILETTPAAIEYQKLFPSEKNQVILIPSNLKTHFGHVDKCIYEDKISYISHDNQVGILIQDETLAMHEKAQFEYLWEHFQTIQNAKNRP